METNIGMIVSKSEFVNSVCTSKILIKKLFQEAHSLDIAFIDTSMFQMPDNKKDKSEENRPKFNELRA